MSRVFFLGNDAGYMTFARMVLFDIVVDDAHCQRTFRKAVRVVRMIVWKNKEMLLANLYNFWASGFQASSEFGHG